MNFSFHVIVFLAHILIGISVIENELLLFPYVISLVLCAL